MKYDGRGCSSLHALLIAVDGGPREALAPLCARTGSELANIAPSDAEHERSWSATLASGAFRLLVVGTSDSARGRRIEGAARRAARAARIPIAAIEDFPGNYCAVEGGEATLVIVESDAAAAIARARLGASTPRLAVLPPARYDGYRACANVLRTRTAERWGRQERVHVLWAGQPETSDCVTTLKHVLPALRACGATLLFKAHPRDAGHASGAYGELLEKSGVDYCDVSRSDVASALEQAPRLVVTQFSSVAVDAGFFSIPSLWVLLPAAGGDRLQEKKGYRVPALCSAGGAALAQSSEEVNALLERALRDEDYRADLMRAFDAYGAVNDNLPKSGTQMLLAVLEELQNAY